MSKEKFELSPQNQMLFNEIMDEIKQEDAALEGVKIKRQTWDTKSLMDKRIAKVCMLLAKQNGDVAYEKFVKFFKLSRVWRARIRAKYWGKARSMIAASGHLYEGSLTDAIKSANKQNGVKK